MKKIILTLGLVLVTQFGFSQMDEAFKKDVLKVIEKGDIGSQLRTVKDQVIKNLPAEKQAAFTVEFDASINDLYTKLVPVYAEAYTKEDIKAMIAFYESPVGKKMAEKATGLNEKSQEVAKEWGQGLQSMMMKYME
jgi:hypothetical protein